MLVFFLRDARCTEASFLELEFRQFIYIKFILGSLYLVPKALKKLTLFQMIQQIEMLHASGFSYLPSTFTVPTLSTTDEKSSTSENFSRRN